MKYSLSIKCEDCHFFGTLNVTKISSKDVVLDINNINPDSTITLEANTISIEQPCPECGGKMYAPSGLYFFDREKCEFIREEDFKIGSHRH